MYSGTLNLQHQLFRHLQWIFFPDSVLIVVNGWIYCSFWKAQKMDKEFVMVNSARAWGMNLNFRFLTLKRSELVVKYSWSHLWEGRRISTEMWGCFSSAPLLCSRTLRALLEIKLSFHFLYFTWFFVSWRITSPPPPSYWPAVLPTEVTCTTNWFYTSQL